MCEFIHIFSLNMEKVFHYFVIADYYVGSVGKCTIKTYLDFPHFPILYFETIFVCVCVGGWGTELGMESRALHMPVKGSSTTVLYSLLLEM